jgi:curli biogenesis system outer membrane secretion channel CsgG
MKNILSFVCVLLLSATSFSASAGAQAASSERKPRIAIVDFDYATVHTGVSAIFGTNVDVGKGIGDLLVTYLVKDGTYSVIERAALDKILAEQNFSNSDRADPSSAAKIGRLLGVDAILVGSITQFGNDTRNTGVGGVGAAAGRLGLGGVRQKQSKAIVGLNARLVNVDTGEILAATESLGESQRTSTSLTGAGGSWRGFGAGNVDFGSSDFQNTIIGEAVKQAVEKMSGSVVAERSRVQARHVAVQGLVAAVSGSQLVLNVGSRAGVKVGDQLNVERVTGEIKDPESGKVIRRMTSNVGVVRVVDVDEQSAVADVVSGSDFKVSDVVRTAPK